MKNSSTFIYFVKSFLAQSDSDVERTKNSSEKNVTELDESGLQPSKQSIQKILNFARSYDVVETESTGQIEMNYN